MFGPSASGNRPPARLIVVLQVFVLVASLFAPVAALAVDPAADPGAPPAAADPAATPTPDPAATQIGRASCRERVYVLV